MRLFFPRTACVVLVLAGVAGLACADEVQISGAFRPLVLEVSVAAGAELQGNRGNPVAMGASGELLWRGLVGGFVSLLGTSGASILPSQVGGTALPALGDRLSVPFGVAFRPLVLFANRISERTLRYLAGFDIQAGVSVEQLRTSANSTVTAGFHGALAWEVPLWGSPMDGGLALRVGGRLIAAPEVRLEVSPREELFIPRVSGQLYAGAGYYF